MLLEYFGFRDQPFGVTPDPRFLYYSHTHREALASLVYGIESGRGFSALIAGPGMGKTTLLFQVLESFQPSARTAFVFQTQCNSSEFLSLLLADLGIDGVGRDLVNMHQRLNEVLVREAQEGRRCIVVLDEAHNLDISVLETVRLLSNFETPHAKLLQIVIAGQAPLADKLASAGLEQLRQRISTVSRLAPFESEEVEKYIAHRLRIAGYLGEPLFSPEAQSAIVESSAGIPRKINNLCFNALSLCCALKQRRVERHMVEEAIADMDLQNPSSGDLSQGRKAHSYEGHRSTGDAQVFPAAQTSRVALPTGGVTVENRNVTAGAGDIGVLSAQFVGRHSETSGRDGAALANRTSVFGPRSCPVHDDGQIKHVSGSRQSISSDVTVPRDTVEPATAQSSSLQHAFSAPRRRVKNRRRGATRIAAASLAVLAGMLVGSLWRALNRPDSTPVAHANMATRTPVASPLEADKRVGSPAAQSSNEAPRPISHETHDSRDKTRPAAPSNRASARPRHSLSIDRNDEVVPEKAMIQVHQPAAAAEHSRADLPLPPPSVPLSPNSTDLSVLTDSAITIPTLEKRPELPEPEPVAKITRMDRPTYARAAQGTGIEGQVWLKVRIGGDGVVKQVTVLSGNPILAQAAADAVRRWHYEPYRVNGIATDFWTTIRIDFDTRF